jgi:hypothetical protein
VFHGGGVVGKPHCSGVREPLQEEETGNRILVFPFLILVVLVVVTLSGLAGTRQGLVPEKYLHQHVTFIVLLKHNLKMAQLTLLGSRYGIFARSFSMVGFVTVHGNTAVLRSRVTRVRVQCPDFIPLPKL